MWTVRTSGITIFSLSALFLALMLVPTNTKDTNELQEGQVPSLTGATGWLNTQPLNLTKLRGKVVLIDFWTYTCINWRRTLPYIRDWASRYHDQGLVVIGVHTPEFAFEHKFDNVRKAIADMNIAYPVAMDNNFNIWNSFQNQYWPALYLIDDKGKLRYHKFGEGDYQEIEAQIRDLLKTATDKPAPAKAPLPKAEGSEAPADWGNLQSTENFLGYGRSEGFASPEPGRANKPADYSVPEELKRGEWALSGRWNIQAELVAGKGKIAYRFHARDLHLIMGSAVPGKAVKFRVLLNGMPPGPAHGLDTDSNGYGTVEDHRMYQLIRQQGAITDQYFEIEFFDQEVEVFDFTFG
jgi:thiol-disulfide isomerase/thioredoxin